MAEHVPAPGTSKRKNPWRRQLGCVCATVALLAALLSVTAYLCFFRSVPLEISTETTYVTGPLKSDGKQVDYLAAWEQETYPENMATEENGYQLIVRHLGTSPDATPAHSVQISHKLGLAAGEFQPDMTFEEPGGFLQVYVSSGDFDGTLIERSVGEKASRRDPLAVLNDRLSRPWTLDDLPMMEAWLAENGPAMDLIGHAVRKRTFHIPLATDNIPGELIAILLPQMQQTRSFARMLIARANYRTGTGDVDGAIDDIVACKRLGRHVGHGGPLVQVLVGIAIEAIADSIGIASSPDHPPTKQQLQRLIDELNDLPPKPDFGKALLFERYATLDVLQTMARDGKGVLPTTVPGEFGLGRLGLDWNVIARRVNENYDSIPTARDWPGPSPTLRPAISLHGRSEMAADAFSMNFLPATGAAFEASRRVTCVDRMRRIALAMLLYERDRGTLPPACTVDAGGKPLHSWRVLLLPYLGQSELYDKIRLDEPWDSKHNRQFHENAVPFYQCPSEALGRHETTYSVVVGPDTPFQAGEGKKLAEFGRNSANMILVVERKQIASWMDPTRDLPQATAEEGFTGREGGGLGIGSQHPGGANFGHADGSIQFLPETIEPELFRQLLRGIADGIP